MRERIEKLFEGPSVIGMVHLLPLPGVPGHSGMEAVVAQALADARSLLEGGVDALLIENMHDFPCLRERQMGPEVAAAMTRVSTEVRRASGTDVAIGIQVLFAANRTAVAVSLAADLDFIRAEGWTYGHLADKGYVEASAGEVVRYQRIIGADEVLVLADIKKKHASHALTADLTIAEVAANLELQRVDGAVVTGTTTGKPPDIDELREVRAATKLPLVIGSGITAENVGRYRELCDAMIIGSALKEDGDWRLPVSVDRVRQLISALRN